MKLYEKYPDSVTVGGKRIRLDLDFRNVLRMMDILAEDDLMADARDYLAMKCICRHPRKGMKKEVMKLLFTEGADHERITDFDQDADMIRAAFLQAYRIDLNTRKMHWFEFSGLLSCLPEGSMYTQVLSIRARPIPAADKYNAAEREWLMKAKALYAIRMTEKEQQTQYSRDVQKIGEFLLAFAGEE